MIQRKKHWICQWAYPMLYKEQRWHCVSANLPMGAVKTYRARNSIYE